MSRMKAKIFAIGLLLNLDLSAALAGQPDPRFEGVWVGVETYTVYGNRSQWANAPIQQSAVIAIGGAGKVFAVVQGLTPGRYDVSPESDANKLKLKRSIYLGGRTNGTFVLSSDGSTLTETGFGYLPGRPRGVSCSIAATFHRQGKR